MEPSAWNIVVQGAWNRAILTPNWIAVKAIGLPIGAPADVLVPMDGFAPFQVHDKGLTVVPTSGQLLFEISDPTEALLLRAMEAARRAIDDLPRTPLRACGINLRYSAPEPPTLLLDRMRCKTEQVFSDAGYELRVRRRGETLAYNEGTLNVIADIPTTGPIAITLNFDLHSTKKDEILAWLSRSASEYMAEATKIIGLIAQ